MDDFYNEKNNSLISGTSGNDIVLNGGSWDDSWHEDGSKVTIKGNAGNDYIDNTQNGQWH